MQERTSRQDLVVPPGGRSATPVIVGAVLCGCVGFAIIWISGIGRTLPVTQSALPAPSSAAALPAGGFRGTTAAAVADQVDRYAEPNQFVDPEMGRPLPASPARFPTRPASFEAPLEPAAGAEGPAEKQDEPTVEPPAADGKTPPGRLSRFSARQITPPDAGPDQQAEETPNTTPAVPAAASDQPSPPAKPAFLQPVEPEPTMEKSVDGEQSEPRKTEPKNAEPKHAGPRANKAELDPAVETDPEPNEPVTEQDKTVEATTRPAAVKSVVTGPDVPQAADTTPIKPAPAVDKPAESVTVTPLTEPMTIGGPQARETKPEQPTPVAATPLAGRAVTASVDPTPPAPSVVAPPAVAAAAGSKSAIEAGPAKSGPAPGVRRAEPVPPPALPPQPLASDATAAPLAARANPFARPRSPVAAEPATTPPEAALQPTAGAVPFAAAPPLTETTTVSAPPATGKRPPSDSPAAAAGATGQGRPGVPQLEGLQTPQLTIEKSGPRDLQVGKPARFEVTIRNVGAATAYDTVLRDSIPYGTSLIATMPPASPAGQGDPTGDLLWSIGELNPGQEARVAMELMPRLEGEIGSVASVSFRAAATVRSRVTKPALEITAEPPQQTLIGEAMTLELTISNPGTGTATGVVVEGQLPEAVSHPAGREVEFDVGRLEPGTSRSITLVLTTVTPGVHEIRLAARADGGIEVAQRLRAEITAPMLELAADIPSRRYLQRPATCKLKMTNTGTAPALAVELAAQLPTGMKFVRANNAGYYDERTHRVLWSLEELPAGEDGTVELVVMPTTLGPQAIVAAARNPSGLADQLTHTIEVEGLAALSFEVVDSEDPIEIGGLTEYVVRVTNQGTKAATNVELAANLLGDLEPIDAKGPVPFGVENLLVSFDPLATLAPADEAVFRIRVRGRRPGNQRVQFMLKSDDQKTPLTAEEMTHVYSDR